MAVVLLHAQGFAEEDWKKIGNLFEGFETDMQEGLPAFWCSLFPYLATILPSIFHTSAIWLTVYLAVQRFAHGVQLH